MPFLGYLEYGGVPVGSTSRIPWPIVVWNQIECRGPACDQFARYKDGYCVTRHRQKLDKGFVWPKGTMRRGGRKKADKCIAPGCEEADIFAWGRCRRHATTTFGDCWLPWCSDPGTHATTGLCEEHRSRQATMRSMYGIGWRERLELSEKQCGKCAICGAVENLPSDGLHIDHCHETGEVRGLLCGLCNRGIRALRHDVSVLRAAIRYLEGP